MKPRNGKTAPQRDLHRLKAQLSARERQFAIALKALKKIVEFESAHLSIFETEVFFVQSVAREALMAMHDLQLGKRSRFAGMPHETVLRIKEQLNQAYGPFGTRDRLYGLLPEDE